MKHSILYILLVFLTVACQKESDITSSIGFENLYVIKDDPNDSIQHKRYEIYQTYGVPVYFNDTIGKVFIKTDINGDSIFQYETLDLNWIFDGTNSGSVTYNITRLHEPDLQMKALHFAEIYLQNSQEALYPYAMWLTKKCYRLSSNGVESKEMISRYRNLMISWIENLQEKEMPAKATEYRNEVVKLKVQNYSEQLNAFDKVTDEKYYNHLWESLHPNENLPHFYKESPWFPQPLEEEWEQDSSFREDMKKRGNHTVAHLPQGLWSDEDVDNYIIHCRDLVGVYGFIGYDRDFSSRFTPKDTDEDLSLYLDEMLKYPRAEFQKRWGKSPLVLKKYEILYKIIRDELGVEL